MSGLLLTRTWPLTALMLLLQTIGDVQRGYPAYSAHPAFALTADNLIFRFTTTTPETDETEMVPVVGTEMLPIVGLPAPTAMLAIAFRMTDQQLYGIATDSRLYRINTESGLATAVNAVPFAIPLDAFTYGMDFHPVTGELHIVGITGLNMRVDPNTGAVIDGDPATSGVQPDTPVGPGIAACAFSANWQGSPGATLSCLDTLNRRTVGISDPPTNPPNFLPQGQMGPGAGFDILPHHNETHIIVTFQAQSAWDRLPSIGPAPLIDTGGRPIRSLAILSVPTTLWAVQAGTPSLLIRFSSPDPETILSSVPLQGFAANEEVVTMQFAAADGRLYAITNQSRVYTIATATGQATAITATPFAPALDGTTFSGDIDGAMLTMTVVSDTGQRLAIDLVAGTAVALSPLAAGSEVVGATTGRSLAGAGFFGIDRQTGQLVSIQDDGSVVPRGPLNVEFTAAGGFETSPADGHAFAVLWGPSNPSFRLFTIDLNTGAGFPIDRIGNGVAAVRALAAAPSGAIAVSAPAVVPESAGAFTLTLTRVASRNPTMVDVSVRPVGTGSLLERAGVPEDVAAIHTSVLFAPGQATATLAIPIVDDAITELNEIFELRVDHPTRGVTVAGGPSTFITIQDNDAGNPAPFLDIQAPTTGPTFRTTRDVVELSGRVQDDQPFPIGFTPVTVTSTSGFSGTATFDEGTHVWTRSVPLQPGVNTITVTAIDPLGNVRTQTIAVHRLSAEPPPETGIYVLAEGMTGSFFDTEIALLNPHEIDVPIRIDYLTSGGLARTDTPTLPARSHRTILIDAIPGLEATEVSTVVTPLVDRRIVVERTMSWDATHYGSHAEKATEQLSTRWIFAEGSQGFFSTYLLLANPQPTDNTATVKFLVEGAAPVVRTFPLLPSSRRTIGADTIPELIDMSFGIEVTFAQPAVAERAMYFGQTPLFKGGHESAGIIEPSSTWFFAEGATGQFFKTFILLANPNPTAAGVAVKYRGRVGNPFLQMMTFRTIPPNGRVTINVELEHPALISEDVSTEVLSSVPIVAERSMYWPANPEQWEDAHNSLGHTTAGLAWGLAGLRTGGPEQFQSFVLLAETSGLGAAVTVTFVRENGAPPIVRQLFVGARVTLTTGPGSDVPELQDESFGVLIESNRPIVVEHSTYSSPGGRIFAAGSNVAGTRVERPACY